jgi:queuine tRNA-ribosyltransferase
MAFEIISQKGKARRANLMTSKGVIKTPCFMPIATKGNIKALSNEDLLALSPDIILSNTYHLMLRPGKEEIAKLGGLHKFMNWPKPILTDSGGFQVFSLAKIRKLSADGVSFNSHIDGKEHFMRPEDSMDIQLNIGSDIIMVLDECVELPANREYLEKSVEMTTAWAKRCREHLNTKIVDLDAGKPLLFGIVQGGTEADLRERSAEQLKSIGFEGYAIGGLAVGESEEEMLKTVDLTTNFLPEDKPRYLMGVGYPHQIVEAVKRGVDMFDCVIPTREARHGRLYIMEDESRIMTDSEFYSTINVTGEKFKFDLSPINEKSKFPVLRNLSKAYLRHLFVVEDPQAFRLATLNNLEFYLGMMETIRAELER